MHRLESRALKSAGYGLLIACAWMLAHSYQGIAGDARIYALQALATLRPELSSDVYLGTVSQDRYTLFSPLFAQAIRAWGLDDAALILTVICLSAVYLAASRIARRFAAVEVAWLGVAMLAATDAKFGAYEVFHLFDSYMTARLPAQALILGALAAHLYERPRLAAALAGCALLLHPLMAFPGIVLLLLMSVSTRAAGGLIGIGLFAATLVPLLATGPVGARIGVMDPHWLHIVEERSQFLFLRYWRAHDWQLNLQPLLSLAVTACVFTAPPLRRFCVMALVVAICGWVVTYLGGEHTPVSLMIQGQAWRWMWIAGVCSTLLAAPTMLSLWRQTATDRPAVGALAALLVLASWMLPSAAGLVFGGLALAFVILRSRIDDGMAERLRWPAGAVALLLVGRVIQSLWAGMATAHPNLSDWEHLRASNAIMPALLAALAAAHTVLTSPRGVWPRRVLTLALAALAVTLPADAFKKWSVQSAERTPPAAWPSALAANRSVYVADGLDSPVFAWFALGRTSYLSLDQSAGVVFARDTALEIERRSRVLEPLMPPDWKLLTKLRAAQRTTATPATTQAPATQAPAIQPLTATRVAAACADPKLGYLIAQPNVGFAPIGSGTDTGTWNGWYLYDCERVRAAEKPPAAAVSHCASGDTPGTGHSQCSEPPS